MAANATASPELVRRRGTRNREGSDGAPACINIALHLWLFDLWDSPVAPILFGESRLTLILLTDWIPGHLGLVDLPRFVWMCD